MTTLSGSLELASGYMLNGPSLARSTSSTAATPPSSPEASPPPRHAVAASPPVPAHGRAPFDQSFAQESRQGHMSKSFTPSCSRCRAKKLKCDYRTPCGTCIAKGLADECHKDMRIPRGRRGPRTVPRDPAVELSALKRKVASLEAECQMLRTQATRSHDTKADHAAASACDASLKRSPAEYPASSKRRKASVDQSFPGVILPSLMEPSLTRRGSGSRDGGGGTALFTPAAEAAAMALEAFAKMGRRRVNKPCTGGEGADAARIPPDQPHPYWSLESSRRARLALFDDSKRALPDEVTLEELLMVFAKRTNHITGHAIYVPDLRRDVRKVMSTLWNPDVSIADTLDPTLLAPLFMVLCLSFEFHPHNRPPDSVGPGWDAVHALRAREDAAAKWLPLAVRALALEQAQFRLTSFAALQAAVLLLVYEKCEAPWLSLLHKAAVQAAHDMALHRLGQARCHGLSKSNFIRLETGVRIWNSLCVRDWCNSQESGSYLIHPSQFNTRRPLHLPDDDLEAGITQPRPMDEYNEMSFVLAQTELGHCIRDLVDVRNQETLSGAISSAGAAGGGNGDAAGGAGRLMPPIGELSSEGLAKVDQILKRFLAELPPYFAVGSEVSVPRIVNPQRWVLHQQVFNQLVRIHRHQLASQTARAAYMALAHEALSLSLKIRGTCPIIDGTNITYGHILMSACVVMLDLIVNPLATLPQDRLEARKKVEMAMPLQKLRRGAAILNVLLQEEQSIYEQRLARGPAFDSVAYGGQRRQNGDGERRDAIGATPSRPGAASGDNPVVSVLVERIVAKLEDHPPSGVKPGQLPLPESRFNDRSIMPGLGPSDFPIDSATWSNLQPFHPRSQVPTSRTAETVHSPHEGATFAEPPKAHHPMHIHGGMAPPAHFNQIGAMVLPPSRGPPPGGAPPISITGCGMSMAHLFPPLAPFSAAAWASMPHPAAATPATTASSTTTPGGVSASSAVPGPTPSLSDLSSSGASTTSGSSFSLPSASPMSGSPNSPPLKMAPCIVAQPSALMEWVLGQAAC